MTTNDQRHQQVNNQYNAQEIHIHYHSYLSAQKEMSNNDPYAEYLKRQFNRIDQFLKSTFQIAIGGIEGYEKSIPLSFQPKSGIVNDSYALTIETEDPLTRIIGKRYEESKPNYADLREAYLDYQGRLLVLGESGAGKTIALLFFARDSILRRMEDPTKPLPILGIIPTWNYKKQPSISKWLQDGYQSPENVENIINEGRGLLILDGLDELVPDEMDSVDPQAMFLNILPENNHIVLTCRFHTSTFIKEQLRLHGAVSVMPLSKSQVLSYVAPHPYLSQAIKANLGILSILNTPMMLTLFTEAYHDDKSDKIREVIQKQDTSDVKSKSGLKSLYIDIEVGKKNTT